jgi:mitogen-activated protein kinase 1/3
MDLSEQHVTKLLYNTLCSLAFCHMCNIMHRDLKPANILINNACQAALCDFGLSRSLPETLANRS